MIYNSIVDTIGNTPMVRLNKLFKGIPGTVLAKVEYVNQKFFGYPVTNIKNGGKFSGMMLEGVVAF